MTARYRAQEGGHGYVEWEISLKFARIDTQSGGLGYALLSSSQQMELSYDNSLGCRREMTPRRCERGGQAFFYRRNLANGITNQTVVVFYHWGAAPREVRAGTGTFQGSLTQHAFSRGGWVRSMALRGNDVETYLTAFVE